MVSAFKDNSLIILKPLALPEVLNFQKFIKAQENVNVLRAGLISIFITFGAEVLTIVLAFPACLCIARIQTRLSPIVETIFSLGFLIPGLAILMPIYMMTAKAGLLYHPIALVILYPAFNLPLWMISCPALCASSRANWRKVQLLTAVMCHKLFFIYFSRFVYRELSLFWI